MPRWNTFKEPCWGTRTECCVQSSMFCDWNSWWTLLVRSRSVTPSQSWDDLQQFWQLGVGGVRLSERARNRYPYVSHVLQPHWKTRTTIHITLPPPANFPWISNHSITEAGSVLGPDHFMWQPRVNRSLPGGNRAGEWHYLSRPVTLAMPFALTSLFTCHIGHVVSSTLSGSSRRLPLNDTLEYLISNKIEKEQVAVTGDAPFHQEIEG